MRCDQVPASLAAGGPFARWRARRHLAGCPSCSRDVAGLGEIAGELAQAPPLTPAQRALWTAAMSGPATTRRPARPRLALMAVAALILAAAGVVVWYRAARPEHGEAPKVVRVTPPQAAPAVAIPSERRRIADDWLARIDRLDVELETLRREAELLDIRRDANELWSRYGQAGGMASRVGPEASGTPPTSAIASSLGPLHSSP